MFLKEWLLIFLVSTVCRIALLILGLIFYDPENGWLFFLFLESCAVAIAISLRFFTEARMKGSVFSSIKSTFLILEVIHVAVISHLLTTVSESNSEFTSIFWILLVLKAGEVGSLAFINGKTSFDDSEKETQEPLEPAPPMYTNSPAEIMPMASLFNYA